MSIQKMSFPEIVRMYQKPLYWYIRKVVLIHEDSEDILQETFIKAYRHLWKLRSGEALKSWLFKIATNEMNRYFRSCKEAVIPEHLPDAEMLTEGDISEDRVNEILSAACLRMSPLQREVFILKYYVGMEYDEISRITGSSKNTLMVSFHNARKIIEDEINK